MIFGLEMGDLPIWFMQFTIYDLLNQWEFIGVFDLMLPFLLIFAVIFGALTSTNILGGHKGVNLIIALVIALMALRLNFVSAFFTELFPRFGVGLAILLVVVILAALFIPNQHKKGWAIGFAIAGVVIGIIAVINSSNQFNFFGSFFWQDYWGMIIGGVILVIVIIAIFATSGKRPPDSGPAIFTPWHKSLHE
jgi:hypothetical protein